MRSAIEHPALLISDDDRDLRESLGALFTGHGFRTLLAEDGKQAYELACGQDVHLAIIDFNMPRMTGLEALRRIKQRKLDLPVILMSAQLDEFLRDEILAARAFSVHSKPINISQIRADVSLALRQMYGWALDY